MYANYYGKYLGSTAYFVKNECIFVPLREESNMKYATLKLKNLKNLWSDCKRPLVNSLMQYYRLQTLKTVFHDENWALLLGSSKMIYPEKEGKTLLGLTPYFVKECSGFDRFMIENLQAVKTNDNTYLYKNAVLFLDPFQIAYPGGKYFDREQSPNDTFRICYVSNEELNIDDIILERYLVLYMPFKSKPATVQVSRFLERLKPQTILMSNDYQSTDAVKKSKCKTNPRFILQDVLDSYSGKHIVGVVIEAPIQVSYEFENPSAPDRQFYALAINCVIPKEVLYVPKPYDRYYHQSSTRHTERWSTMLYDFPDSFLVDTVIFDYNVVGYSMKGTFFCLSDPGLCKSPVFKFHNVREMFGKLSFDLSECPDVMVLNTFRISEDHVLYCVKHRQIKHELWCLSEEKENTPYLKKVNNLPRLVEEWASLLINVPFSALPCFCVDYVKLLFTYVKHGVCFSLEKSKEFEIRFTPDIVFCVDKPTCDFVNGLRLKPAEGDEEESNCSII